MILPGSKTSSLVDTNVWLWQVYTNAPVSSSHAPDKIRAYTPYLRQARQNGATLVYSGLVLAELAHVIEKTEWKIYKQRTGDRLKPKEFRHNKPVERTKVVEEVESAWMQVQALAVPIDLEVNEETTNAAMARFRAQALDGYDLLMIEAIGRAGAGQVKVITDDSDYATVPGIQVFTNNDIVLQQAPLQGKLLTSR